MQISDKREREIIATIRAHPDDHLTFRGVNYRPDGGILITRNRLRVLLHRYLYEQVIGPVDDNDFLIRTCQKFGCQNPHHRLAQDAPHPKPARPYQRPARKRGGPNGAEINRSKTHCPQGHEYTPDNIYIWHDRDGNDHRKCKTCTIERTARQHERDRIRLAEIKAQLDTSKKES